jgi:hypothetical protein
MCDIMTGVGVWITNGEYDGGVTYYFFLKTPPHKYTAKLFNIQVVC